MSITPSSPEALGIVETPSDLTTCLAISGGEMLGLTMSALEEERQHTNRQSKTLSCECSKNCLSLIFESLGLQGDTLKRPLLNFVHRQTLETIRN